ncbi:hypothetical protein Dimus_033018 [Dionaea muscipula]
MTKLYRRGTVHPSPPQVTNHHLSYLPAAIFALTAALTADDREVLAYLVSCSSAANFPTTTGPKHSNGTSPSSSSAGGRKAGTKAGDHTASFSCNCFRCYMSYWVRWDSSPNRQLIHEIIDAFEDWLARSSKRGARRERRKKGLGGSDPDGEVRRGEKTATELGSRKEDESTRPLEPVAEGGVGGGGGVEKELGYGGGEERVNGPVRKLVSFIEEKIWSVWIGN